MAAQPDGGTPVDTGSDGGDQEVDLRALQAQVERNSARIKRWEETLDDCESRLERCERVTSAVVETLDRDLRFAAKELRALLA